MAAYALSETCCLVYPGAMDEQGVEEHRVSLLHDEVNLGNLLILIKQPMEKFVARTLLLWIAVRLQGHLVCPWLHDQAAVVLVSPLHGGPGADDAGCGPEGEVMQVLMHGVEKSLFIRIWKFIYQHGVHCHDVWPCEALNIFEDLWQSTVSEQLFILLEVLHFINYSFRLTILGSQGLIFHNHSSWWIHLPSTNPHELLPEALNVFIRNKLLNEQIPIVFIELPLLCGEDIIVQGIAKPPWLRNSTHLG